MTRVPAIDAARCASCLDAVRSILSDCCWHTLSEITTTCRGRGVAASEAGVSARIRELRHEGLTVERRRVAGGGGLHEYRVVATPAGGRLFA